MTDYKELRKSGSACLRSTEACVRLWDLCGGMTHLECAAVICPAHTYSTLALTAAGFTALAHASCAWARQRILLFALTGADAEAPDFLRGGASSAGGTNLTF